MIVAGYAISFIILFTNFYIRTYVMKGRKKAAARENGSSETVPKANGVSLSGANNWQKKENWTRTIRLYDCRKKSNLYMVLFF